MISTSNPKSESCFGAQPGGSQVMTNVVLFLH